MADTIRGKVTDVIDGDTFDMKVTHTGKNNKEKYNDNERIRISGIDEPELNTPAGVRSKEKLEKKIKNREVRCHVKSRDVYGRVIADVNLI